jgi:hypothetical protein
MLDYGFDTMPQIFAVHKIPIGLTADGQFIRKVHDCSLTMVNRPLCFIALGLLSNIALVSAQPGPLSTTKNSSLVLPAAMMLTNGLPGLSGPPANLMVASVESNSDQGGIVSLAGNQAWERRFNGPVNSEDQAYAVTVDKDGNIIVGGYSVGTGLTTDFTTIKYTPDGTAIWTNRYDDPDHGTDKIETVATDGSGAVYVSGDANTGISTVKYAADGTPVWSNYYTNNSSFLGFQAFAVDSDGNAYLMPFDFDAKAFVTIKYDVNGNPAWTNTFNSSPTSTENPSDIAVDAAGNVFVTGSSFDSSVGALRFLTIQYASDGSILWLDFYSLTGLDAASRVIVDALGNVIVAGDSQSGTAQHRYLLVEYSNSGTLLWTNSVSAANYSGGGVPQITTDPAGNVFLVGATPGAASGAADYTAVKFSNAGMPVWTNRFVDPSSGTASLSGTAADNAGNLYWSVNSASPHSTNYNYVTLKYAAADGTAVWTNRYNGAANGSDVPRAMIVDRAGGVYVTGASSSTTASSFTALDWATIKYADNLRYSPPANFTGQDTITFTAFDSLGNSALGTVIVNVLPGPPIVVAPGQYTSTIGDSGLNTLLRTTNAPRTYQMQFTPAALGGLPIGARIMGLGFRLFTNNVAAFPASTVSWSNYQVTLAQAAQPISSMSTNFSANLLNPVLVEQGVISIGPNTLSAGSNPNPFATIIPFDTPYLYTGGDLVMHFTHSGSDSFSTAFLDAATTNSPGYGTSFRAMSANAFNAANGIPSSVTVVEILFSPSVSITSTADQLIISGSGGLAGQTYQLLTSTNIALPANEWTPIVTDQFGAGGGFNVTNTIQADVTEQYFRVVVLP